jgi:quercetin dioxygenase-like cupin family protein
MTETDTFATRTASGSTPPLVLISGKQTGGRFAVIETRERCDATPPRHIHAHEDEIVYVLEGRVLFETAGNQIPASAGCCVFLPRDSEHSYRIESDEARLLIVVAPAGLEGYYRELHRPVAHESAQPEIERVVTLAARFGLTITGPGR